MAEKLLNAHVDLYACVDLRQAKDNFDNNYAVAKERELESMEEDESSSLYGTPIAA